MQKEKQVRLVHLLSLGKRQRFPHEAAQRLPERVVETLNMVGLPRFPATHLMLLPGQSTLA